MLPLDVPSDRHGDCVLQKVSRNQLLRVFVRRRFRCRVRYRNEVVERGVQGLVWLVGCDGWMERDERREMKMVEGREKEERWVDCAKLKGPSAFSPIQTDRDWTRRGGKRG